METAQIIFRFWLVITSLVSMISMLGLLELLFEGTADLNRLSALLGLIICWLIGAVASEMSSNFKW